jgi:hypothetical protein
MASSNVSTVTNLLPTVNEGFTTTLGGSISSGATAVPLTSITGLTNGTVFIGIIEPGGAKEQVFTGLVDTGGSQVTSVKWTRGTNIIHTTGVTIVDYVTGTAINMISTGMLKQHKQTGAHGAVTADSLTVSGDASITGSTTFTGPVTLPNTTVTASNLNLSPQAALVSTGETTTSTSYTDLTTSGPSVTVTIGHNGLALLTVGCDESNATAGAFCFMGWSASGANTIAVTDGNAFIVKNAASNTEVNASLSILLTGLTPGATTFIAKYKTNAGTANFSFRRLAVIPL